MDFRKHSDCSREERSRGGSLFASRAGRKVATLQAEVKVFCLPDCYKWCPPQLTLPLKTERLSQTRSPCPVSITVTLVTLCPLQVPAEPITWHNNFAELSLSFSKVQKNRWVPVIHLFLLPMRKSKFREVAWHVQSYTAGEKHSWGLNPHLSVFQGQDPSSILRASRTIWLHKLWEYQNQDVLKQQSNPTLSFPEDKWRERLVPEYQFREDFLLFLLCF